MGNMPPPEKYVGIVEELFAQTLVRIVKAATTDGKAFVRRNGAALQFSL
jgi:hypothetical protein